jgi:CBS domain-containing protein
MTTDVHTISEDTPVGDIVDQMERDGIKRLPVVRDGRVVGIVSRADLLRALIAPEALAMNDFASDAAIRAHLAEEIAKQPWAPR